MSVTARMEDWSLADLAVEVGVTLTEDADRAGLTVHFPDGTDERWIPAPDGYPLDGSRELVQVGGRYYVPEVV
jgi:hypothetical protein